MGKHALHRLVKTALPAEGIFAFTARARQEGAGLRVTVPAPVARGFAHLGAGVGPRLGRVRARLFKGPWFDVWLRFANSEQVVMVLPLAHRGAVKAGDSVSVEVMVVAEKAAASGDGEAGKGGA